VRRLQFHVARLAQERTSYISTPASPDSFTNKYTCTTSVRAVKDTSTPPRAASRALNLATRSLMPPRSEWSASRAGDALTPALAARWLRCVRPQAAEQERGLERRGAAPPVAASDGRQVPSLGARDTSGRIAHRAKPSLMQVPSACPSPSPFRRGTSCTAACATGTPATTNRS
jgi:hypothetical protein